MAKDKLTFENFTRLDKATLEMIYKWRTSPEIAKYMDTSADFTLESHFKFCEALKNRKDRLYYLVKLNGVPFGVFDYTDIDDKEHIAEAGIYVIENYRKYTRIVSACEFLVAYRHGIKKIKMHVNKDNVKAVLYNLVKVKNKMLGEDDKYVYFESVYKPFDECMELYSDIFEKYECEVLD